MDTSKIYIKMCDCPEIQGQWRYKHDNVISTTDGVFSDLRNRVLRGEYTWLPRQDQIQEMIDWKLRGVNGPLYQIEALDDWSGTEEIRLNRSSEDIAFDDKYDSLEKCWLAFYMSEKHSKTWDGEKWIKKQ